MATSKKTKFKSAKLRFVFGVLLLALSTIINPASAAGVVDLTNPAFVAAGGSTSIPVGHAEFCAAHRGECGIETNVVSAQPLTEATWRELLNVNATINSTIAPVTDEDLYRTAEYWTYPRTAGDCEDYVLAKRRELISLGWPASTLLITVVKEASGSGHAVLLVRTDRGDLVLDNQDGMVKVWNQTGYQFIKRQSQTHAGQWVDLVDTRPLAVIASL